MTTLHHVAECSGSTKQADLLLAHGAHLDATARHGRAALSYAMDRGHTDMVAHLSKLGARQSPSPEM